MQSEVTTVVYSCCWQKMRIEQKKTNFLVPKANQGSFFFLVMFLQQNFLWKDYFLVTGKMLHIHWKLMNVHKQWMAYSLDEITFVQTIHVTFAYFLWFVFFCFVGTNFFCFFFSQNDEILTNCCKPAGMLNNCFCFSLGRRSRWSLCLDDWLDVLLCICHALCCQQSSVFVMLVNFHSF